MTAPEPAVPGVDVRRASGRFATDTTWLRSRHSFSFSHHHDPANTHHGLLVVNNDDVIAPGTGFDTHPHRDMEIVTWVLAGSIVHQDSEGNTGVIHPGLAQKMSAGTGIRHSEKNDTWHAGGVDAADGGGEPVHLVQMWVLPDETGLTPGYEQLEIDAADLEAGLVPVASGRPGRDRAVGLNNRHATLHATRVRAGRTVTVPEAPYLHVYVARGSVDLEGAGPLGAGDAARLTGTGGQRVTALTDAEVLVWEMHAHAR